LVSGKGGAEKFLIRKPKQFLVFHNEMGLEIMKKSQTGTWETTSKSVIRSLQLGIQARFHSDCHLDWVGTSGGVC